MTDLTTHIDDGSGSNSFVYDAARQLYYYASAGTVRSFDPLTGAIKTVATLAGTIGGLTLTPDGAQLLIGMVETTPDSHGLQQGTVYRIPMATADNPATYAVLHYACDEELGVNDLAAAADGQVLMTTRSHFPSGNVTFRSFPANVAGVIAETPVVGLDQVSDFTNMVVSEHGRYILIEEGMNPNGTLGLYDSQAHRVISEVSANVYNNGFGDVSEAAGQVFAFTDAGLELLNLDLNLATGRVVSYPGHTISDGKFNIGGRELFLWDRTYGVIDVFDTRSLHKIGQAVVDPAGASSSDVPPDGAQHLTGHMKLSADGHFLLLQTETGFESLDLVSRLHVRFDGTSGNDTLVGTQGCDTFAAGAGNDWVSAGTGDDWLSGGAGDDQLDGGAGFDIASYVEAGVGTGVGVHVSLLLQNQVQDTGPAGVDFLTGIEGLVGSSFADTLIGDGGNNTFDGGPGADTMIGGTGNDTYYFDRAEDQVVELARGGIDEVRTTFSLNIAGTYIENVTLLGSHTNATGNGLDNVLLGSVGSNTLKGSYGNDTLNGEGGNDLLVGGPGQDRFVFTAGSGQDRISDFSAADNDLIDVTDYSVFAVYQSGVDTVIDLGGGNTVTVLATVASDPGLLSHIVW